MQEVGAETRRFMKGEPGGCTSSVDIDAFHCFESVCELETRRKVGGN